MRSPRQRLLDALEAWQRERAMERVARWREDPEALDEPAIAARHARLRGPRARELYEETLDREELVGEERAATEHTLREAHLATPRSRADARLTSALDAPIPYDSDFHRGRALLHRLTETPSAKTRRAIARALDRTFPPLLDALAERRSRIAEALDPLAWLAVPHPDRAEVDAEAVLAQTDDAWRELLARIAHAGGAPADDWTDVLHVLRATRWDDLVPRRSRARRASAPLDALGLGEVLARGARIEPGTAHPRAHVLVVTPSVDVRIAPGVELGVASERDFAHALGRAAAHLLAHPGVPAVLRRPGPESVARTVGALYAHLFGDPTFASRAFAELSPPNRRAVRELAVGVELFELRTAAAAHLGRGREGQHDFLDDARERFVRAWAVDVPPRLAGVVSQDPTATERLRAARLAPALAIALREQYDEDFWRNPRTVEPIRHAAARAGALTAEAWATELGVTDAMLGARMTELLG